MKWDIDKSLREFECLCPGTTIGRVYLTLPDWVKYKLKLSPRVEERQGGFAWCLALGKMMEPKVMIYGDTIRDVYLKARKHLKAYPEDWAVLDLPIPRKRTRGKEDQKGRNPRKKD